MELQRHQNSLEGAWISNRDLRSVGKIDEGFFVAFGNGFPHFENLHLGGFHDPVHFTRNLIHLQKLLPRLKSLTFQPSDNSNLLCSIKTSRSWRGFCQRFSYRPIPPLKLSQVTSLSLKFLGDQLFESIGLDEAFDINKLQTLKLFETGEITSTLKKLQKFQLSLKVFYLSGETTRAALLGLLGSFSGLHELYLDIRNCEIEFDDNLELHRHCATLSKLFVRFRTNGVDPSFGGWFHKLLREGNIFPMLTEVALTHCANYVSPLSRISPNSNIIPY